MAKTAAATAPGSSFPLGLDEFCARLSAQERRVALIGGFHAHARGRGLLAATEAEFRTAWDAYIKAPG